VDHSILVPQISVLRPFLFLMSINDIDEDIKNSVGYFGDDTDN